MKKFLFVALALLCVSGLVFAQDDWTSDPEGGDEYQDDYASQDQFVYIGAASGIMYIQEIGAMPSIYNLRGGVHGDVLFSFGMFEVGVELGAYVMEVEDYFYSYTTYFALDVPLDAICRINFDDMHEFGIEVRAGGWLRAEFGTSYSSAAFMFNAGGRIVISYFYLGGDYLFDKYNGAWAVEAGGKFYF
jgi:hypothetical protein